MYQIICQDNEEKTLNNSLQYYTLFYSISWQYKYTIYDTKSYYKGIKMAQIKITYFFIGGAQNLTDIFRTASFTDTSICNLWRFRNNLYIIADIR